MIPGTHLMPIGLFITGWTARADVHWIAPDIGIAVVGVGLIVNFQTIQTYVIDAFTLHAASGAHSGDLSLPLCCMLSTNLDHLIAPLSSRCGNNPSLSCGLRLSLVRSGYVQCARLREGRYYPCVRCYGDWRTCVSGEVRCFSYCAVTDRVHRPRPFLFWKYGEKLRNASRYAKR